MNTEIIAEILSWWAFISIPVVILFIIYIIWLLKQFKKLDKKMEVYKRWIRKPKSK
jgi:TM2 domain-containing membrane protein YozV